MVCTKVRTKEVCTKVCTEEVGTKVGTKELRTERYIVVSFTNFRRILLYSV